MTSKIGRFIPLAMSGSVLIGLLLSIKEFGTNLNFHFNFGAGAIYIGGQGIAIAAPFFANLYLHLSLFFIFLAGVFLFANYRRMTNRSYLIVSILMLTIFLFRPVIALISFAIKEGQWYQIVFLSTLKGLLTGVAETQWQYDFQTRLPGYLAGIVLLLLLLINLILAFRHKQDPAHAEQKQQQKEILRQQAQARQSAFAAQQQMQAQAFRQMPAPVQQQGVPTSMTQELERLQQMYNSGALTEEEFTVAKKRVLGN